MVVALAASLSATVSAAEDGSETGESGISSHDPFAAAPTELHFGEVEVLDVEQLTITIWNTGQATETIVDTNLSAPDTSVFNDFSWNHDCTGAFAEGESCTVRVGFAPTSTGVKSGIIEFEVVYEDPQLGTDSRTFTISVDGTGVEANLPVTVEPTTLDFGEVLVGDTVELPVTVTNVDDPADPPTFFEFDGGVPASDQFTRTRTCAFGLIGQELAPGETCTYLYSFTPDAAGAFTDSATITISVDGIGNDFPLSMSGTGVSAVEENQAPVAADDNYTVEQDSVLEGNVLSNDSDPDGDPLVVFEASLAAHGTVTWQDDPDVVGLDSTSGAFMYEPEPGFVGTDTFTYGAFDNVSGETTRATVTIGVTEATQVEEPANAVDDSYTVEQGDTLEANVVDNDSNATCVVTWDDPDHGSLTFVNVDEFGECHDGAFTFQADPGFVGIDTFTYQNCRVPIDCDTATATIEVTAVAEDPDDSDDPEPEDPVIPDDNPDDSPDDNPGDSPDDNPDDSLDDDGHSRQDATEVEPTAGDTR